MMQSVVLRCAVAVLVLQTTAYLRAQSAVPPAAPPSINAPTSTTTLLSQAESSLARGDYDQAVPLLNKALANEHLDSQEDARILYDRGYAEQQQHHLDTAEADYRKACSVDPKQFESHAALGRLLAQQQQWKQARNELEAAVKLQPTNGNAQQEIAGVARTLARVDAEMHDPAAASEALLTAIQRTHEQADDTSLAAQLAEMDGDYTGAEQEYRKILAADPTSIPAAEGLGQSLIHQGKFADAESALQPVLAREPNDPTLLAESATALAGQGNAQAAILQLEELHRQNPEQPAITRMLADLYSSAGEAAKAEPLYHQLLAGDSRDPDLLTATGENYLREQKWAQALAALQRSLQMEPTQVDAWSGVAFAASQNGQYSLVLDALDHRAQYTSEGPATLFLRASALDHLHRTRTAIVYYRKFLSEANNLYPEEQSQSRQRLRALEK